MDKIEEAQRVIANRLKKSGVYDFAFSEVVDVKADGDVASEDGSSEGDGSVEGEGITGSDGSVESDIVTDSSTAESNPADGIAEDIANLPDSDTATPTKKTFDITIVAREISENFQQLLLSQNNMQIMTQKADVNFNDESNPYVAYFPDSYNPTEYTQDSFRTIAIKKLKDSSGGDSYFAIIKPWPKESVKFNDFLSQYTGQTIGIMIDGFVQSHTIQEGETEIIFGVATDEASAKITDIVFNTGSFDVAFSLVSNEDLGDAGDQTLDGETVVADETTILDETTTLDETTVLDETLTAQSAESTSQTDTTELTDTTEETYPINTLNTYLMAGLTILAGIGIAIYLYFREKDFTKPLMFLLTVGMISSVWISWLKLTTLPLDPMIFMMSIYYVFIFTLAGLLFEKYFKRLLSIGIIVNIITMVTAVGFAVDLAGVLLVLTLVVALLLPITNFYIKYVKKYLLK